MEQNTQSTQNAYQKEVMCFYDWLETNSVGSSCICLWFALLHTWHKAGCRDEFAVAISTLEAKTGLKRDAIGRARNKLQQVGRIEWYERKGKQSAVYKVVSFIAAQNACDVLSDTSRAEISLCRKKRYKVRHKPRTKRGTNRAQSAHIIITTTADKEKDNPVSLNHNSLCVGGDGSIFNAPQKASQDASQTACDAKNVTKRGTSSAEAFEAVISRHSEDMKTIKHHYERYFGVLVSNTAAVRILEFLDLGVEAGLVCRAIDEAVNANVAKWNYARKILDDCVINGILTVAAFEAKETGRKLTKAQRSYTAEKPYIRASDGDKDGESL